MRRRSWGRRTSWFLLGVAMIAVTAWVVVRAVLADTPEELQLWTNWANVVALPVGLVSAVWLAFDRARKASPTAPGGQRLDRVIEDLTHRLERDWAEEAVLREVTRPRPIRVRWSPTGERSAGQLLTFGAPDANTPDELVTAFRRLPDRQLMVLGGAGAGKSVFGMLLTLGLLRSPAPAELPVLLPITGWDPEQETVETFVVRRLVATYADVLASHGDPQTVAERLAADRRLLPILDGLDELPPWLHPKAMEALDTYAAMARPLVVTCRLDEYVRAVERGRVLSQAAVVELGEVYLEDAIRYLSEPVHDARWNAVFDHLRAKPDGHLAKVFGSPLMVSLARSAYLDPSSDPAELLSLATEQAITGRLMNAFITGAYTDTTPRQSKVARRHYPPDRTRKWLTCLAYHLEESRTTTLYWRDITPTLLAANPRQAQRVVRWVPIAAAAVLVWVCVFLLYDGWVATRAALATAWIMGIPFAALLEPRSISGVKRRIRPSTRPQVIYGISCGVLTGFVTLDLLTTVLAGPLITLLVVMVAFWYPPYPKRRLGPTSDLRMVRRATVAASVQFGLAGAVVFALVSRWTNPAEQVFITGTAAAVYGLTAALAEGGISWLTLQMTHARLAFEGWLPWRLWRFLDDAHRRGVLRQAGAEYQFRHALLQDHLAIPQHITLLRARVEAGDADVLLALHQLHLRWEGAESALEYLRERAKVDSWAAWVLAGILAEFGHVDDAIAVLEPHPDRQADMLGIYKRHEQLIALLEPQAQSGDEYAARRLAHAYADVGRVDEGIAILRRQAGSGDDFAGKLLADMLAEHGRAAATDDPAATD